MTDDPLTEARTVAPPVRLARWSVALETPDATALAAFYRGLLGWQVRSEDGGWVTIGPGPDGPDYLGFNTSEEYERPTWPPAPGKQQMTVHLDFCIGSTPEDLSEALARAVQHGAREAEFQPQDDVRVMIDPDGHPFCLYYDPEEGRAGQG